MTLKTLVRYSEAPFVGAIVPFIGLLRPEDPIFALAGFYPQIILAVLAASFLGTVAGFCFLSAVAVSTYFALPFVASLLKIPFEFSADTLTALRYPMASAIVGILVSGLLSDGRETRILMTRKRFGQVARRYARLDRTAKALDTVNSELQSRVSGQRESVSNLYAAIRAMDNRDLKDALSALLHAVRSFSQADRAAVYEFDPESLSLVRRAFLGECPPEEAVLPLRGTIEGWVFRNNETYTLRQLHSVPGLDRIAARRNIFAIPLRAGDQPWGVLNIAEMPFYRYSPSTERAVEVVASLASPYLKRSVDARNRELGGSHNEFTGLPVYSELVKFLDEALGRRVFENRSLSVIVFEILGYERIVFERSGLKAMSLLKSLAKLAAEDGKAVAFHYNTESRLVFVLSDLDFDGAAQFCFDFLFRIATEQWGIDGEPVRMEPAYGIAAAVSGSTTESLFEDAERMLDKQKSAVWARAIQGTKGRLGAINGKESDAEDAEILEEL